MLSPRSPRLEIRVRLSREQVLDEYYSEQLTGDLTRIELVLHPIGR